MSTLTLQWREEAHGPLKEALTRTRNEGQLKDDLGQIIYAVLVFVRDHNLEPEPGSVIEYVRRCFGVATCVFDMRIVQHRWVPWIVEALNADVGDLQEAILAVGERMNTDYYAELTRHYKVTGVL